MMCSLFFQYSAWLIISKGNMKLKGQYETFQKLLKLKLFLIDFNWSSYAFFFFLMWNISQIWASSLLRPILAQANQANLLYHSNFSATAVSTR